MQPHVQKERRSAVRKLTSLVLAVAPLAAVAVLGVSLFTQLPAPQAMAREGFRVVDPAAVQAIESPVAQTTGNPASVGQNRNAGQETINLTEWEDTRGPKAFRASRYTF